MSRIEIYQLVIGQKCYVLCFQLPVKQTDSLVGVVSWKPSAETNYERIKVYRGQTAQTGLSVCAAI